MGLPVYLRYGMVEVDRVDVDLEPYGATNGEWNRYALLHKPAPTMRRKVEADLD
jgi:hypothetical protein